MEQLGNCRARIFIESDKHSNTSYPAGQTTTINSSSVIAETLL